MWSFGCILVEMVTGKPLFLPVDEKELLEQIRLRIGRPSQELLQNATRKDHLYDENNEIIRSERSRIQAGIPDCAHSIKKVLEKSGETEEVFRDFIERCLVIDPAIRMTPE